MPREYEIKAVKERAQRSLNASGEADCECPLYNRLLRFR